MTKAPRGLVYDLETSYILAHTFSLYPESIPHSSIVQDWHIHCGVWKWVGEDRVYSAKEKDGCDKHIVEQLAEAMQKADYVIAHNGDKFDMKKLTTRAVFHKLPPLPPVASVDTLKEARALGAFSSNRLDYLGEFLGLGRKLHNSPNLWKRAFVGDKKAINEMLVYCKQDVHLLEDMYLELRPYMKKHPNYNVVTGQKGLCTKCGSPDIEKRGFAYTQALKKQRMKCNSCGAWHSVKLEKTI
jgi:DNA polymerase III epsilon subunit-like protein